MGFAVEQVLSLELVKSHLRVDHDLEDEYLVGMLAAAIAVAEDFTGRRIIPCEDVIHLDRFPARELRLPVYPAQDITQIQYEDTQGNVQELAATEYRAILDVEPPLLLPATTWPATAAIPGAVRIHATVGYAVTPASIQQALLLLCGHWYENREVVRERYVNSAEMPFSVSALLYPYKILRW